VIWRIVVLAMGAAGYAVAAAVAMRARG